MTCFILDQRPHKHKGENGLLIFTSKIKFALIILLTIFIIGTVGFHLIEGWSLMDSFYTTIATLSTVGYGDYAPETTSGKIFTIFVIIFGVGMMFYTLVLLAETFIESRLSNMLGRGKLEKIIEKMHNHYIICGGGRIGFLICRELIAGKMPCVVVDNNPEVIQKAQEEGFVYCKGDATQDKVLIEAGIKRAKGIICVLPTDAENLYVILTAKDLNQKIYIMARSEEEESEHRLLRAGADRVMSPYTLGGVRMAMAILRPAMLDFIEITTSRQSLELRMEEISVCKDSPFISKSLEDSGIRKRYGLIIVAVKKDSGKMIFNPMANYIIAEGDRLIAMGEDENVKQFAESCLA
ncbi:MAG: potassium channel protein [Deltaproteobacteria bacterium HGW-Deltaproteobacteria-13]|nr:MAG: potassium channel protein [Deltaproteobacteria bacterium HGW-Deltaproteobacteria-13]